MSDPLGQSRRGLTLVESMMASVVLAISVFAIIVPFTMGVRNEESQQRRTVAVAFAEELMEEILSKPFSDPQGDSKVGPEATENSRELLDNIDDYHGLVEELETIAGQVVGDLGSWGLSRHVTTEYVYVSGQQRDQPPTFARVIVEVRHEGRPMVMLTRLVYSQE